MGNLLDRIGALLRLTALRVLGRFPRPPIHPPWHLDVISTPLRAEGWGDGLHDHAYPYSGVALLNTFYFLMTRGQTVSSTIDHHLEQIMLLLDFPDDGTLHLGFDDINDNDQYRYVIAHHAIQGEDIRTGTWGLDIGVGTYTVQLDRPDGDWVFVLRGFQMAFRGVDHHINVIGVRENNGYLTVDYRDQNGDDTFVFRVQYAWVPQSLFKAIGDSGGSSREYDLEEVPSGRVVIRGFQLDFQPTYTSGGDHHIKEVGVLGRDGRIDVVYSDRNGDDGFTWLVNWAILGVDEPVVAPVARERAPAKT